MEEVIEGSVGLVFCSWVGWFWPFVFVLLFCFLRLPYVYGFGFKFLGRLVFD